MPNKHIIEKIKSRKKPYKNPDIVSLAVRGVVDIKSSEVYRRIKKFLNNKNILDVGVGAGGIFSYLKDKGYRMTGLDVIDSAIFEDTKVTIYDGCNFPYKDDSFDIALIVQVLHHCQDGFKVLSEARRVAKRVIVIEDTYRNELEKSIVSTSDKLGNWEFYEHPYHTSEWWKNYLQENNYKIIHFEEYSTMTYLVQYGRYALFVIE